MNPGFSLLMIRPLIERSQILGRSLEVRFVCPHTGRAVDASWNAAPIGVSAAVEEARRRPLFQVRAQVNRSIRLFLGYGYAGRTARWMSDAALSGATGFAQLSAEEEEIALVGAFRSVSSEFVWHEGRWIHGSAFGSSPGLLLEAVEAGPALTPFERRLTARMLVAVAEANGPMSDDERLHLTACFDQDVGSIESLVNYPPLTAAELAQSNHQVRTTMLELAWSMAFCDAHFHQAEEQVIERFAQQLGVPIEERVEAKRVAQLHVINSYLQACQQFGTYDQAARDGLHTLAERIGVTRGAAERAEAKFFAQDPRLR